MSDNTSADTGDTGTPEETNQAERTFTQAEVNAILAKTKGQYERKYSKLFEELGTEPDELKDIVTNHRKREQDNAMRRGEFDKVLQEVVAKKDQEIQRRDRMIEEFKLNAPILDSASRHRAVAPEQVRALIRSNVRLNQEGEVEVVDQNGTVRYGDNGKPLSVDTLVSEFLQANPHFVAATPSTTAARSTVNQRSEQIDVTKLDLMNNPEHRKIYREYRKSQGIVKN